MTATTHPEFDAHTEGLEVAAAFAEGIRGKTIVVTGVNLKGLGFSLTQSVASQSPAHLILPGRSLSKIQESIDALKLQFPTVNYRPLQIDLSNQTSIRAAAAELLSWTDIPAIDLLVNSAGIMFLPERTLSADGIEMHFATNHIGHFLFSCLIMPKLIKASEKSPKGATRIVGVSAGSAQVAKMRWSDMSFEKTNKDLPEVEQPNYGVLKAWGYTEPENRSYVPLEAYNQSKVANCLFGVGATKRLFEKFGILSLAVHPGVIQTELGRNALPEVGDRLKVLIEMGAFSYKSFEAGSSTTLVAALDPKLAIGVGAEKDGRENYGAFLDDCQISGVAHPLAVSSKEAEKLWELSEKLVGEKFAW